MILYWAKWRMRVVTNPDPGITMRFATAGGAVAASTMVLNEGLRQNVGLMMR